MQANGISVDVKGHFHVGVATVGFEVTLNGTAGNLKLNSDHPLSADQQLTSVDATLDKDAAVIANGGVPWGLQVWATGTCTMPNGKQGIARVILNHAPNLKATYGSEWLVTVNVTDGPNFWARTPESFSVGQTPFTPDGTPVYNVDVTKAQHAPASGSWTPTLT